MIRDPSDGSVKPAPTGAKCSGSTSVSKTERGGSIPPASAKSGLPPIESDQINRLQRSREWLKTYRTNPEAVMRKMGETE